MVGNDEKKKQEKSEKREGEKEKKDGITSRWTRRLAFTVSEASMVANGERRISDWPGVGKGVREGKRAAIGHGRSI